MRLKDQTVVFESIQKNDVQGTFGEGYAVANVRLDGEALTLVFGRQIPENYAELSKISQALRSGEKGVEAKVSVAGTVNIGKLDGSITAAQQTQMLMGMFLDVE